MKLNDLSPEALKAAMESGTEGWGRWGGMDHHKCYMQKQTYTGRKGRRMCPCGCRKMETHSGMANGVALTAGCELYVRRWLRQAEMRKELEL